MTITSRAISESTFFYGREEDLSAVSDLAARAGRAAGMINNLGIAGRCAHQLACWEAEARVWDERTKDAIAAAPLGGEALALHATITSGQAFLDNVVNSQQFSPFH